MKTGFVHVARVVIAAQRRYNELAERREYVKVFNNKRKLMVVGERVKARAKKQAVQLNILHTTISNAC